MDLSHHSAATFRRQNVGGNISCRLFAQQIPGDEGIAVANVGQLQITAAVNGPREDHAAGQHGWRAG